MNIAASKGLKTVLTTLTLWKEIDKRQYNKYYYIPTGAEDWGNQKEQDLIEDDDYNVRHYSCVVDKNRAGAKAKLLFSVDLNKNVWREEGRLFKK